MKNYFLVELNNIVYYGLKRKDLHWKIENRIGKGSYGNVYKTCLNNYCGYVMKIIKNKHYEKEFLENTKNEVSISKAAEDLKVAPKVIDYYITNDYGIVIFERWTYLYMTYLTYAFFSMKKLC